MWINVLIGIARFDRWLRHASIFIAFSQNMSIFHAYRQSPISTGYMYTSLIMYTADIYAALIFTDGHSFSQTNFQLSVLNRKVEKTI